MVRGTFKKIIIIIGFVCTGFLFTGCLTYKEIVNFQDGADLGTGKLDSIKNFEQLRIQPNDILSINVSSYNIEEASRFNIVSLNMVAQVSGGTSEGIRDPIGYRVDAFGKIDMPVIGPILIKDLTVEEVKNLIHKKVGETGYLKDYSVEVRFLTFKVTILGEVNAPGTYTINNTKLNALEALGLAGDVTVFSNRDNILIIREQDGQRQYGRLDIKTKNLFESPFYYLKPNDVIYVEPHKSRILTAPDPVSRYATPVLAVVSLITLIIAIIQ